jgi:hypothetical protein
MKPVATATICGLISLGVVGFAAGAVPSAKFYPFPGYDLETVRAKTKAESAPDTPDLAEAWRLYGELQGSWRPGAPKPDAEAVAAVDALAGKLEALPRPAWYAAAMDPGHPVETGLADAVGDPVFEAQKATPEYQALKALALVYLTEHELDRKGAAENARRCLVALAVTHPWDWQVHGLYGRFLVDAQLGAPAWEEAKLSLFLDPDPQLNQLKAFAFIGAIAEKSEWPEIQEAMRQACRDGRTADLAIGQSEDLYSGGAKMNVVTPRP